MHMVDGAFWPLSVKFNKSAAAFLITLNGSRTRGARLSMGRNQKRLALRSIC